MQQQSSSKRRGWLRCLMPWNAASVREDVEPDYAPLGASAFPLTLASVATPIPIPSSASVDGRPGAAAAAAAEESESGTPGSVLVRDDVPDYYDGSFYSGVADEAWPVEVHANEPYCSGGASGGQLAVLVEGPLDKEAVFLRACEQAGPGFSVYVGDGLNDLLALLSADCGILIGACVSSRTHFRGSCVVRRVVRARRRWAGIRALLHAHALSYHSFRPEPGAAAGGRCISREAAPAPHRRNRPRTLRRRVRIRPPGSTSILPAAVRPLSLARGIDCVSSDESCLPPLSRRSQPGHWSSRGRGVLYTASSWDEVTMLLFGALSSEEDEQLGDEEGGAEEAAVESHGAAGGEQQQQRRHSRAGSFADASAGGGAGFSGRDDVAVGAASSADGGRSQKGTGSGRP